MCLVAAYLSKVSSTSKIAPPLRNSSELQSIKCDIVASERRITLNITENPERIEGCVLVASVIGIMDKVGNVMSSASWSFTVQHDYLQWQSPEMTKSFLTSAFENGDEIRLSATMHNNTGEAREWSLEGVPAWMEASLTSGTLSAGESKEITFRINNSITIGSHVGNIYLMETNGISHKLPFDVTYQAIRPDWAVNPDNYESTMSIIGQVKVDGVIQENPNSIIAAFNAKDECIGLCMPEYMARLGAYYYMMTIYGNKSGDKTVNFRYYDASTGIIHPSLIVDEKYDVSFAENKVLGTPGEPLFWTPDGKIEQHTELRRGWNWISFNTVGTESTKEVFANSIIPATEEEANVMQIVNGESFMTVENGEWGGTLQTVTTGTMYKVQMSAPATFKRVGKPVNLERQPISIRQNWNWLGANVSTQTALDVAMADMNPAEGDVIKNRTELAMFTEGGWIGSLRQIEPGAGYFYFSNESQEKEFVYPTTASALTRSMTRAAAMASALASTTDVVTSQNDFSQYTGTMTMIAAVEFDGQRLGSCELQAYDSQDKLRGVNISQDNDNRHLIYIVIHGEDPEPLTFCVVTSDKNSSLKYNFTTTIDFTDGDSHGTMNNPVIFNLSSIEGLEEIRDDSQDAPRYDLMGRRIQNDSKHQLYIQDKKKLME